MDKSEILKTFNNHITEFFDDVLKIFPEDNDIKVAKTSLIAMRKANPRLIINSWKEYIADKYTSEIEAGNVDFFLYKNYSDDVKNEQDASMILDKIDTLREPIKQMGEENLQKTIKYIQNLTKLCIMYK